MPKPDPSSLLPLTPAVLHILLSLSDGPLHGYAIAQQVESLTHDHVRMGPGTLYGSLQRMIDDALVEPAAAKPSEQRRRNYKLTPLGRRVLALELQRLDAVVTLAKARQLLGRPGVA
jgi:DNA-binding PadR family transcriptional regulator